MDGNSSLKHVANDYRSGSVRQDERTHCRDMWISEDVVYSFKDKVKSMVRGAGTALFASTLNLFKAESF